MVIQQIYKDMCAVMEQNENCDVSFEANQLIEFVLGKKRIELLGTDISDADTAKLMELATQRKEGYPLQYILGRWQFFDMDLSVGEGVLIPRQDTETVCEAAFEVIRPMENPKVTDLCSGSGCIALAVKRFCPDATVTAVEKSEEAFAYLEKNIVHTGLDVTAVNGDIFVYHETLEKESLDAIVSNPPYIDPIFREDIQTEVSYEPDMALYAEEKGLYFYKYIAKNYRDILKSKGYLVFEYGFDQQIQVRNILLQEGYTIIKEIVDMCENPHGVVAQKP